MSYSPSQPETGTPVPQNTLLVVGATGSLGRQIVRRALDEGLEVRCIVRPREIPARFLRDWGTTVVNADLRNPSSIPAAMVGIHSVIDAATARPEESIREIDWNGKVALIQTAQALNIKRFIFFSIYDCEKYPTVPLMAIKTCTEEFIKTTTLDYSIIRLCGFMQAIIGNYAIPILEERSVWGTTDTGSTAYLDTQDVAKITISALRKKEFVDRTFTLVGPKAWTTQEVIKICETLSGGRKARVAQVPVTLLKAVRVFLSGFQWTTDASDRLAFTDIVQDRSELTKDGIKSNEEWEKMEEMYKLLDLDPSDILTLEKYLGEYYSKIIKKLRQIGAESRQTDFYV